MEGLKCTAVIVSGGRGRRMGSDVRKQYLEIGGKPILYHTLRAFQKAKRIDEIILVTETSQIAYCKNIFQRNSEFSKLKQIVAGGAERYDSVYEGLKACEDSDFVFIHDGVRPLVTEDMIERGYADAVAHGSAVAGVLSKDTVKIVDANGMVQETPLRERVWNVQTPQIFRYELIREAYDRLQMFDKTGITDDAMVVEQMCDAPVHMFEGAFTNIKVTTPEDLVLAENYLYMTRDE